MSNAFRTLGNHGNRGRRPGRARHVRFLAVVALVAGATSAVLATRSAQAAGSPCGATVNPIVCENRQAGTPSSVWDVSGNGDATIQGFATNISVNVGTTVSFKIKTTASAYTIDIYRLGYYQGNGARKVTTISPSASLPQTQPACLTDPSVTLVDCGNWAVSASWAVPSTAVSGVYLAHLTRTDTGGASLIPFIVRNDASTSDVLFQTSDPTWEAYNRYGDADFYTGSTTNLWDSPSRARKISYNRPFATRGDSSGRDYLFSNEYPTIRFLERNGYDVSYIAGVDTDRYGSTLLTKHKMFLSVGHDEYWSQAQRTNVENARSAGVNLMFLSGNEVFWHTRYQASIDGSNTAYRTLVCYKETWDNAATDPSGEATATWRDPRFSAAPGGTNPENALTGTIYMANSDSLPLTVTAAQGKERIWRNTGLASMSGASTDLAPNIVGYESDEDLDNGFRNAGQIDLSTTVGPTDGELVDFGQKTKAGTTTHHLVMYRAASGALVFGAGTIQWGWGLDANHDGIQQAASARIQQATVNVLADMKIQPGTLMTGLVAASASADTTAPTSTITNPASGANLANGTSVTVTGTAGDVGGVVAGVEVSLDGGASWHPATGTTSWSYTGILHGTSTAKILSRATDDSLNTESPSAGVTVSTSCPCTVFGQTVPTVVDSGDAYRAELGMRFTPTTNGFVTGVRFYKSANNTGSHIGTLWSASGTQLATGTFTGESASGWQTLQFASPVAVSAGTTYVVGYWAPNGHYSEDPLYFYYRTISADPLRAEVNTAGDASKANGVYASSNTFPSQSYLGSNYFVDPVFVPGNASLPSVVSTTPTAGAANAPVSTTITATFSTAVTASSVQFTVTGPSGAVAGATTYASASNTATFTPSASLAAGSAYSVSVTATGTDGTAMTSPYSWSFATAGTPSCPCTLFAASATPGTADSGDRSALSVGMKFTSSVAGYITGARFYKASTNTGTHTASLWSASGTRLATATFGGESASGWQSVTFSPSVAVAAGTTYVISYYAPAGHYSEDDNYFASPVTRGPLTAPAGAGVYAYGGDVFPSSSYANANYWVDPVFSTTAAASGPTVTATTPTSGATGVATGVSPTVTFSVPVTAASVQFTLTGPGGTVNGTTSYASGTKTATFAPAANLLGSTTYTASVTATGADGTAMGAPYTWSFTTAVQCPCTLFGANATPGTVDGADAVATSLGVQFSSSVSGSIAGIRFYKSAANTGTHTGSLWSASGTLLAKGTFTGETASGWQTLTFPNPISITANTTYVVSYYAPNGHYAEDNRYFASSVTNGPLTAPVGAGVYALRSDTFPSSVSLNANYWVDPIFSTAAGVAPSVPPAVTTTAPSDSATGVATAVTPSATFSDSVDPNSIAFTLATSDGTSVTGSVAYDASGRTATFTPDAALSSGTAYTATVTATGTNGLPMTAAKSWSFTTSSSTCPCTLFAANATPGTLDGGDRSAVTLGVTFSSSVDGSVTGVRFYKAAANTGTHVAYLWSASGALLASATYTGETATGWQTATFDTPVAITAGTSYVVGYLAPAGHYSEDTRFFRTVWRNSPLTAPVGAGVYAYGSAGTFPTGTYANANYWVDPIVSTG